MATLIREQLMKQQNNHSQNSIERPLSLLLEGDSLLNCLLMIQADSGEEGQRSAVHKKGNAARKRASVDHGQAKPGKQSKVIHKAGQSIWVLCTSAEQRS